MAVSRYNNQLAIWDDLIEFGEGDFIQFRIVCGIPSEGDQPTLLF